MTKLYVVTCGYDYNAEHEEVVQSFWDKDKADEFYKAFEGYQFGMMRQRIGDRKAWLEQHPWPQFEEATVMGMMEIELPSDPVREAAPDLLVALERLLNYGCDLTYTNDKDMEFCSSCGVNLTNALEHKAGCYIENSRSLIAKVKGAVHD